MIDARVQLSEGDEIAGAVPLADGVVLVLSKKGAVFTISVDSDYAPDQGVLVCCRASEVG